MQVVFVNYADFNTPSAMHIFSLANALTNLGVRCNVINCRGADNDPNIFYGKPKFKIFSLIHESLADIISQIKGDFIIHCWTPRERPRLVASYLHKKTHMPLVVHMEDNEEQIVIDYINNYMQGNQPLEQDWNADQHLFAWAHPQRYKEFMATAQGYTCIIEDLLYFKPETVPGIYFWPACEEEFFDIPALSNPQMKKKYGLPENVPVVFYPGNMHMSNMQELINLYLAIDNANKSKISINIIKFGQYSLDLEKDVFKKPLPWLYDLTGKIKTSELIEVMQAADILIQPGSDTPFNRYRFPCKLPMFMASGRPLITPQSNIGRHLTKNEHCLFLETGSPDEILAYLKLLIKKPQIAHRLGQNSRKFARENFSWAKSAQKVLDFYKQVRSS